MVVVVMVIMVVRPTRESGIERGARSKRREKLHPFESHPRTPSGLKKSIKQREIRCGGRREPGRRVEGVKEREKENGVGRPSEQTALSSG